MFHLCDNNSKFGTGYQPICKHPSSWLSCCKNQLCVTQVPWNRVSSSHELVWNWSCPHDSRRTESFETCHVQLVNGIIVFKLYCFIACWESEQVSQNIIHLGHGLFDEEILPCLNMLLCVRSASLNGSHKKSANWRRIQVPTEHHMENYVPLPCVPVQLISPSPLPFKRWITLRSQNAHSLFSTCTLDFYFQ